MLKGDLATRDLPGVLSDLAAEAASGCLQISDSDGHEALVYFKNGLVYAPDKAWVETWMTELCNFPVAKHDDLVDSTSMALSYLRGVGAVRFDDEVAATEADRVRPRSRLAPGDGAAGSPCSA